MVEAPVGSAPPRDDEETFSLLEKQNKRKRKMSTGGDEHSVSNTGGRYSSLLLLFLLSLFSSFRLFLHFPSVKGCYIPQHIVHSALNTYCHIVT